MKSASRSAVSAVDGALTEFVMTRWGNPRKGRLRRAQLRRHAAWRSRLRRLRHRASHQRWMHDHTDRWAQGQFISWTRADARYR